MKLQVHERLALLDFLKDHKDSFAGLKSTRQAREIISFNQEEVDLYKLRIKDGAWDWDRAKDSERVLDAPLDEYVINIVREWLANLNKTQSMTEIHMSLYEKFILNYGSIEP